MTYMETTAHVWNKSYSEFEFFEKSLSPFKSASSLNLALALGRAWNHRSRVKPDLSTSSPSRARAFKTRISSMSLSLTILYKRLHFKRRWRRKRVLKTTKMIFWYICASIQPEKKPSKNLRLDRARIYFESTLKFF